MSLLANSNAIESGGYPIQRSLRFRSSASAYLSRTPASAGNRQIFTWSAWVKRGTLGTTQTLFAAGSAGTAGDPLFVWQFSGDKLQADYYNGTNDYYVRTNAVYRDPSAWYHIILVVDSTQATSTNRYKYYVNGQQITSFEVSNYPSQNLNFPVNNTQAQFLCRAGDGTQYFDGYLAEVNFIDGQALTPSSFGQTDAVTGVWQPLKYMGTYGTNGFYLPFSDNTSATTLAYDKSGNGNNWTANNISTTAGATYDSMTDVPTLTSATAANYAVINPLSWRGSAGTVSNGNLQVVTPVGDGVVYGSMCFPSSGKWYYEFSMTAGSQAWSGIAIQGSAINANNVYYLTNGQKYVNGAGSAYGASWTTNDIIGVAVDCDNNQITFYKNNVSQGAINYTLNTGEYAPAFADGDNATITSTQIVTFGQRPFSYTPPTGFKALNAFNLPDPTIKKPNQYMDATLYTGTGAIQSITNNGSMQPDLVWIKARSVAYGHVLSDSVRGVSASSAPFLLTNATDAEYNANGTVANRTVTSLDANGFTLGADSYYLNFNSSGKTYVGWQWKKGATPGFDIVTYTGDGNTSKNVSHSLGVKPSLMIVKNRSAAWDWRVYHTTLGATKYLNLNTTDAVLTNSVIWNNTEPTSSVFTVGSNGGVNANGQSLVAYLFAEIAGFSKFGSYTGNGSADGPFVYCGFRPKYVMIKNSSAVGDWIIYDTSRNSYNVADKRLQANLSDAETTVNSVDILSNGFKLRVSTSGNNGSGNTLIYAAFAENPFKYSNAR